MIWIAFGFLLLWVVVLTFVVFNLSDNVRGALRLEARFGKLNEWTLQYLQANAYVFSKRTDWQELSDAVEAMRNSIHKDKTDQLAQSRREELLRELAGIKNRKELLKRLEEVLRVYG